MSVQLSSVSDVIKDRNNVLAASADRKMLSVLQNVHMPSGYIYTLRYGHTCTHTRMPEELQWHPIVQQNTRRACQ